MHFFSKVMMLELVRTVYLLKHAIRCLFFKSLSFLLTAGFVTSLLRMLNSENYAIFLMRTLLTKQTQSRNVKTHWREQHSLELDKLFLRGPRIRSTDNDFFGISK